jgi:hypothetical protein
MDGPRATSSRSLSDIGDPDDRDRHAAFLTVMPPPCAPGRPHRAAHRDLGLATKTASVSAKPGAIAGGLRDRLLTR